MADLKNYKVLKNSKFEILTDEGFKDFEGLFIGENENKIKFSFDDGDILTTTPKHKFCLDGDSDIYAKDVRVDDIISGKKVIEKISFKNDEKVFEILHVKDIHKYLVNNNISCKQCIILDEFAHIPPEVAEAFFSSVYPVISSSKKSKVFILSTPKGKNKFYEIWDGAINGKNEFHPERIDWQEVPGRDEEWKNKNIATIGKRIFDQEFGNEFLDDSEESVDRELLEKMRIEIQNVKHNFIKTTDEYGGEYTIFEERQNEFFYSIGVDIAEGVGKHNSCIQVLRMSDLQDIRQVATYVSNRINPINFSEKIIEIAGHWGNPPLMVEANNIGALVIDTLVRKFRYPNVPNYIPKQGDITKGRVISHGIWSGGNSKTNGVNNMRYYMNTLQTVVLNDEKTIDEFKDFVRHDTADGAKGVWKKRKGEDTRDDRVDAVMWALGILLEGVCDRYYYIEEVNTQNKPIKIFPKGSWHVPKPLTSREFHRNSKDPNYSNADSYRKYNFAPMIVAGSDKNPIDRSLSQIDEASQSGYFCTNGIVTREDYERARQAYGMDLESMQEDGWIPVNGG